MAFSTGGGSGPMADINVTPLVDVMLVLLIIFMITVPMLSHKIKIDLPQPTPPPPVPPPPPPDPINLVIKSSGQMFWNDTPISEEALQAQLGVIAKKDPRAENQPELNIHADRNTKYQLIATVMADAKNAGMIKIGFAAPQGE
jgi:biopolymer transport protein ExbD